LRAALRAIAGEHKRWGYRRAHHELCQRGWSVNRKRTQRLWREEGLRVAQRARKRRRAAGQPDRSHLRAGGPDEVWALDFQADMTADGRALRLVNVVDEFTREALVMRVERSIGADETVAQLETQVARRGRAPRFLRCDNGPELTSHALRDWCRFSHAETAFIEPGAPWHEDYNTRRPHSALGMRTPTAFAADWAHATAP